MHKNCLYKDYNSGEITLCVFNYADMHTYNIHCIDLHLLSAVLSNIVTYYWKSPNLNLQNTATPRIDPACRYKANIWNTRPGYPCIQFVENICPTWQMCTRWKNDAFDHIESSREYHRREIEFSCAICSITYYIQGIPCLVAIVVVEESSRLVSSLQRLL